MIDKMRIMKAAFFTPVANGFWGLPILWWGAPGEGKSAIAAWFAHTVGAWLYSFRPGEVGEGGVGRVAVPAERNGRCVLTYPMPEWADTFLSLQYGLLLADEYTTATGIIAQAMPPLVLDRLIAGSTLPKRVRIFAIANPTECSVSGEDLTPPTANRHIHLAWESTNAETVEYFTGALIDESIKNTLVPIDAATEEARVLAAWPSAMASAAHKVGAFLKRHPDQRKNMPPEGDPNRARAWASPRSWEMAIRCLATGLVHSLTPEEIDALGAGCVGENAWQEFSNYMAALDLPDPAGLLDGSIQWAPDTKRLDITATVISGCVALVVPPNAPNRQARANALWALLADVGAMGARDLTHLPTTTLCKAGLMAGGINVLNGLRSSGFQEAVK